MGQHSSTSETELPTREDVQELRESIESLRDHVQIVWQAIDEVREVIEQFLGRDAAEFWNVEPPQGLPLGRYRPFAGYEPAAEWQAENSELDATTPVVPTAVHIEPKDPFRANDMGSANGQSELGNLVPTSLQQQRSLWGAATAEAFQHIGILSLEFHVDKLSRPLL